MITRTKQKLGDVADVIPGFAFKSSDFSDVGRPILKIKNIQSDFSISLENCDYVKNEVFENKNFNKYKIAPKEALIAMTGATIGKVGRFTDKTDVYLNQRVALFRSKLIDNDYLWALLRSSKYQDILKGLGSGAAQANMSSFQIEEIEINIPDLTTQTYIASVLSTYDDLIENNEKRIKVLEEMTQILYTEWFVKFKFPSHKKIKMVDSGTEYGMIPEGWKVKKLKEIGKAVTGKTPSTIILENFNGEILFIKTPDIHGNIFILETEQTLSEVGAKTQSLKLLPEKTVFVSCIGTLGVVGITSQPSQTNQQINALILNDSSDYCFFYLFAKSLREKLIGLGSNGATMGNVNKDKFENINIILPSQEIRSLFFQTITNLFGEILSLQKRNKNLSKTRDLLIPQLVTGKRELK